MANPLKGEVSIEVDGETYTLVYSLNTLCEIEDKLGGAVSDIASLGASGRRWNTLRTVFWAALQDYHPEITLQQAGRMVSAMGLTKADEAVGKAFALAFPEVKTVPLEIAKPAKRNARTGSKS
jgi:hypothetical protein